MKAETVRGKLIKKCYCFDLDDTLIKTDAKTKVYKRGKYLRSLSAADFNTFVKQPDEELDLSDFKDPKFIINARKFKMWPALYNISMAVQQGKSQSDIYILTARSSHVKSTIHSFFEKNHVKIPVNNIITIGDDAGLINIATVKKEILRDLKSRYDEVTFFDDSPENIKMASEIGGIRTRLIDAVNI
jgi:acid phosphatase class B